MEDNIFFFLNKETKILEKNILRIKVGLKKKKERERFGKKNIGVLIVPLSWHVTLSVNGYH